MFYEQINVYNLQMNVHIYGVCSHNLFVDVRAEALPLESMALIQWHRVNEHLCITLLSIYAQDSHY